MTNLFNLSSDVLFGQLLIGLINGSFYALLSLGIAIIFGLLKIINFVHGAQYTLGAFVAWWLLNTAGVPYWWALIIAPIAVGLLGMLIERLFLSRLYKVDHIYSLLLTLGLALVIEGLLKQSYGSSGLPYSAPSSLTGGINLGFMYLPLYRGWVALFSIFACVITWLLIERTRLGAYLRAATENPKMVESFGINVPLLLTITYGFGVGLASLAGVLAAPIYSVNPIMGTELIITVFAVVVIGGLGSIGGAIVTGFLVGILEGFTRVIYPELSSTVVFLLMALVLLFKPAGLFGKITALSSHGLSNAKIYNWRSPPPMAIILLAVGVMIVAPFFVYPVFLMQVLCAMLFASSFILLLGYGGMMSFGQAAFFGVGSYAAAHSLKVWGFTPELALLFAIASTTLLGCVFAALSVRRHGIYFAMITLALAQLVYFICLQSPFTGGEDGITAVPRGQLFGLISLQNDLAFYSFLCAVNLFAALLIVRVVKSPFGHVLQAIRDNEPRAISMGYKTTRFKFMIFTISAGLAGLAGGLKAMVFQFASLTDVHWITSMDVVLMGLIGGLGSLWGAVWGALALTSLHTFVAHLGSWVTVIHGVVFVACVMLFRRGIVGILQDQLQRSRLFVRSNSEIS